MRLVYSPPKKTGARMRQSQTIPDQSLSIQEIVKRYVRGIPVDVIQRKGVYIDQQEHDLEKLSRMDFAEKAEYAQYLADEASRLQQELLDARTEAKRKAEEKAAQSASKKADEGKEKEQAREDRANA